MPHPASLLKELNLYAGKELGQNFISDPAAAGRIVDRAGIENTDTVLEIGAGLGALTVWCAKAAHKVWAVEKDRRLIPLLSRQIEMNGLTNVKIIADDFLRIDMSACAGAKKLVIMGNLPYNISSQILIKLIEQRQFITKAVLMFQKEVAQRLAATPGSRSYGRLSAVTQYCADVSALMDLSPASFFPRPDVDSRVVKIVFRHTGLFAPAMESFHFDVIKAAFSKRRKTLENALSSAGLPVTKPQVAQALKKADIDPHRRAETLSIGEFTTLTRQLAPLCEDIK